MNIYNYKGLIKFYYHNLIYKCRRKDCNHSTYSTRIICR